MLVGDDIVTVERDLKALLERFDERHDPREYNRPTSSAVLEHLQRIREYRHHQIGGRSAEMDVVESEGTIGLTLRFAEGELQRSQTVQIWECNGQCIFLSTSVPVAVVRRLSIEKIVEFTWERNRNTDVVEFMLDDAQHIVGRCVHPVDSLHWREFIYCAHVLAVESDRLEYLVCEEDLF
jgi:hypothetical protein